MRINLPYYTHTHTAHNTQAPGSSPAPTTELLGGLKTAQSVGWREQYAQQVVGHLHSDYRAAAAAFE